MSSQQELSALISVLISNGTLNSRSLNVMSPNAPASSQTNWKNIYTKLVSDSVSNNFNKLLSDSLNVATYSSAVTVFRALTVQLAASTVKKARILVCLSDGTVYFDSNRKDGVQTLANGLNDTTSNVFANASNKTINENHNTRACVINAQLVQNGVSYESKYSTSSNNFEDYVAMRIGPQGASAGTVRYSIY